VGGQKVHKQKAYSFRQLFRIASPALIAVLLFIFASFFLFLPQFEKGLLEEKKIMIKELVNASWGMVDALNNEVASGGCSLEEAQKIAINHLREMRYGIDRQDYFWINDFSPVLVMHPYRPDLVGKNMSAFTDPKGTRVFEEFVKTVRKTHEGYVPYMWQWRGDNSRIVPKLSFVKAYQPWGWIIGTGIYLEDVKQEVASMSQKMTFFAAVILSLVTIIAWYQIYQTLNEVSMRQHAEAELIEYKDQLEIKVAQRTAELSHANAELQKTINEIKTLKGTIPICMDCKEIRDDKGSWSQLEKYISEHSEAEFSHGICDSCIAKRYPDTED
jgi:signal transduction histidine kinase